MLRKVPFLSILVKTALYWAWERFSSLMLPKMDVQSVSPHEGFVTNSTHKWSFPSVASNVLDEMAMGREALVAGVIVTREYQLISSMMLQMLLKHFQI